MKHIVKCALRSTLLVILVRFRVNEFILSSLISGIVRHLCNDYAMGLRVLEEQKNSVS